MTFIKGYGNCIRQCHKWVCHLSICQYNIALVQLITSQTKVTTNISTRVELHVWPVFSCVRRLPLPQWWRRLAGAGASRGGWRPLASSAVLWVFSCQSGSRSLIGWQLGHYLGCRSSQTLGGRPKERETGKRLDEEASAVWGYRRIDNEDVMSFTCTLQLKTNNN